MIVKLVGICWFVLLVGSGAGRSQSGRPHFDAATLKIAPSHMYVGGELPPKSIIEPTRITLRRQWLPNLICWALGLERYRLSIPENKRLPLLDLEAVFPAGSSTEEVKLMGQVLLEEQLGLRVPTEENSRRRTCC